MPSAPASTWSACSTPSRWGAASWSLSNYGPRLLGSDLEPEFKIDHFVKDLRAARSEARRMRSSLHGAPLAEQMYIGAQEAGFGDWGIQALLEVLSRDAPG